MPRLPLAVILLIPALGFLAVPLDAQRTTSTGRDTRAARGNWNIRPTIDLSDLGGRPFQVLPYNGGRPFVIHIGAHGLDEAALAALILYHDSGRLIGWREYDLPPGRRTTININEELERVSEMPGPDDDPGLARDALDSLTTLARLENPPPPDPFNPIVVICTDRASLLNELSIDARLPMPSVFDGPRRVRFGAKLCF